MSTSPTAQPERDPAAELKERNERLKHWLDFWRFVVGTTGLSVLTLLLGHVLKEREVALKESEAKIERLIKGIVDGVDALLPLGHRIRADPMPAIPGEPQTVCHPGGDGSWCFANAHRNECPVAYKSAADPIVASREFCCARTRTL